VRTLAVVVLSWNGCALTRDTLASLAACRTPEGWRVRTMVVDNASHDGSPDMVAREFPDVASRAAATPGSSVRSRPEPMRSCCSTTTSSPTPTCS
jgi:GT2 family glycosyltransferase